MFSRNSQTLKRALYQVEATGFVEMEMNRQLSQSSYFKWN